MPKPKTKQPATHKLFRTRLLRWYRQYARDLPWRHTSDPYAILVSEIMLQQTQVDRVIPFFQRWMTTFPTVERLANASAREVLSCWQGLGYNRRALYLHQCASVIMHQYSGQFPHTRSELESLPGIGPYTSGALLSFAFKQQEAIVDTNVTRVIGRIFIGYKKLPAIVPKQLWKLTRALLPQKKNVYTFNQALMDFGSQVCTLKKPSCTTCPMNSICTSYPTIQTATPEQLRYQKKVTETHSFGYPRRIWRGKVIRLLHEKETRSATLLQIGKTLRTSYVDNDLAWLQDIIDSLVHDGMVTIKQKRVFLVE